MKFAHLLLSLSGSNPEFKVLHGSYKQAKKALKRLQPGLGNNDGNHQAATPTPTASQQGNEDASPQGTLNEAEFAHELVHSINSLTQMRFILQDKCSGKLQQLQQTLRAPWTCGLDLHELYREAVHFHGEVLLVMNWSMLAYTMCLKILKKHHKRTGLLLQAPELRDMLSQPSWSTEEMANVACDAEAVVTHVQQLVLQQAQAEQDALRPQPQLEQQLSTVDVPPQGGPGEVALVHSTSASDLNEYSKHAAAQQASLAVLCARHLNARNAAKGMCSSPFQDPQCLVSPGTSPRDYQQPMAALASGAGPPHGLGEVQFQQGLPGHHGLGGQGRVEGAGLPVLHVASWQSLELLSRMQTSSWDSEEEDRAGMEEEEEEAEESTGPTQSALGVSHSDNSDSNQQVDLQGGVEVNGQLQDQGVGQAMDVGPDCGLQRTLHIADVTGAAEGAAAHAAGQRGSGAVVSMPPLVNGGQYGHLSHQCVSPPPSQLHAPHSAGAVWGVANQGGLPIPERPRSGPVHAHRYHGPQGDEVYDDEGGGGRRRAPEMSASGSCSPPGHNALGLTYTAGGAGGVPTGMAPSVVGRPVAPPSRLQSRLRPGEEEEVSSAVPGVGVVGRCSVSGKAQTIAGTVLPPAWMSVGGVVGPDLQGGDEERPASDPEMVHQMRLALQTWEFLTHGSVTPSTVMPGNTQQVRTLNQSQPPLSSRLTPAQSQPSLRATGPALLAAVPLGPSETVS